jgi:hypothetical protein
MNGVCYAGNAKVLQGGQFEQELRRRSLKSERVKCGYEPRGIRTWEWLRWLWPAAIVNDRPILSSERMLHRNYKRKCSCEKFIVRGSQGACRQDQLIGAILYVLFQCVSFYFFLILFIYFSQCSINFPIGVRFLSVSCTVFYVNFVFIIPKINY